ncbi:MAG: hypothetical protein AAGN66_27415 [Acidobacteriota bacterium]
MDSFEPKRSRRSRLWLGCAALCVLTAVPLEAGVEIKIRTVDHSAPTPRVETSVMTIEGHNLKLEMLTVSGTEQQRRGMIYQGQRERALVVDHGNKAYTPIDRGTIQKLGEDIQRTMAEIDRQIAELAPEQRQTVKKALEDAEKVSPAVVEKTEETGKTLGLETVKYLVRRDGEIERETWVANWDQLPESDEVRAALEGMGGLLGELVKAFEGIASSTLGVQVFGEGSNPFEDLERMGGFPVTTRNFKGKRMTSETSLQGIETKAVDPLSFNPPDSYELRAMTQ